MVLLRDPGQVYLMTIQLVRGRLFRLPVACWVERIHPHSLATLERSPKLKGGPMWPGGFAIHRNGDLYVTYGRWCHRLDPACQPRKSYRLPKPLPYNSLVILDNGYLVMKQISAGDKALLSILDPDLLQPVCEDIETPEPSIARLSAKGNTIYVVGVRSVFRYQWDEASPRPRLDPTWRFDYIGSSTQSYGWDAVVDEDNVWFMDNGLHRIIFSMVGAGIRPTPNRFIRVSLRNDGDGSSTAVCGLPAGSITNPPLYCSQRRILVVYDSANQVIRAYRHQPNDHTFDLIWDKRPFGAGGHMIYYPDSGEVMTNDYDRWSGDRIVILDIETGTEKGRVGLKNRFQGLVFSAPGWERDLYFLSFDRLARVYPSL